MLCVFAHSKSAKPVHEAEEYAGIPHEPERTVEPVKHLPRSHKTKTGGGQACFFGRAADAGKISHPPEMFLSRKANGIVRLHAKTDAIFRETVR